jgi:hypothetical protein
MKIVLAQFVAHDGLAWGMALKLPRIAWAWQRLSMLVAVQKSLRAKGRATEKPGRSPGQQRVWVRAYVHLCSWMHYG